MAVGIRTTSSAMPMTSTGMASTKSRARRPVVQTASVSATGHKPNPVCPLRRAVLCRASDRVGIGSIAALALLVMPGGNSCHQLYKLPDDLSGVLVTSVAPL